MNFFHDFEAPPVQPQRVDRLQIEDRTRLPSTLAARQKHQFGWRDRRKVYALVLHQMACCRRRREGGYDTIGAHFAILEDGRILQLHPIEAAIAASDGFNARSVAVEFAGNFPNTKGKCWNQAEHGCQQLTQAQIEAGRYLIDHLRREINLTHILAHRQANGQNRTNDPGPDIWYHVGQWAIDKYRLSDGGQGFRLTYTPDQKARFPHLTDGLPIPDEWRTWGQRGRASRP